MSKKNVLILLLSLLFIVVALPTQYCSKDDTVRIRVKMQQDAGAHRTVGGKKIPEFFHNPGKLIMAQLKNAGFEIVGTASSSYDFDLIIHHQERGRQVKLSTGQKKWLIFVNELGVTLKDKAGNIIVEKMKKRLSQDLDIPEVVKSLAGNIIEHINKHRGLKKKSSETITQVVSIEHKVKLEFEMSPAVKTRQNGKMVPVYSYDPRHEIRNQLKKAGFGIADIHSTDYKFHIIVKHRERARSTSSSRYSVGSKPIILINHLGFTLKDLQGKELLVEYLGPQSTYGNMRQVVKLFAINLPKYIKKRLEAKDEVEYQIKSLEEEGFNRLRLRRLGKIKDPRAIDVIKPFLYRCYASNRWDAKFTLMDLGYAPGTPHEKAVWDMVDLTRPFFIPAGYSKFFTRGKKGVKVIIVDHGIEAIKLFLQDLKCPVRKRFYEGDATSKYAKQALSMLSRERWRKIMKWQKKFKNKFKKEWNQYAVNELLAEISDPTKINESDRDRYLEDAITILGRIADKKAIETIKGYLSDPKLTKTAKNAIELIKKR